MLDIRDTTVKNAERVYSQVKSFICFSQRSPEGPISCFSFLFNSFSPFSSYRVLSVKWPPPPSSLFPQIDLWFLFFSLFSLVSISLLMNLSFSFSQTVYYLFRKREQIEYWKNQHRVILCRLEEQSAANINTLIFVPYRFQENPPQADREATSLTISWSQKFPPNNLKLIISGTVPRPICPLIDKGSIPSQWYRLTLTSLAGWQFLINFENL